MMVDEISMNDVYEQLEQAGIVFEYYRGVITLWVNGEKRYLYPTRFVVVTWTEYPLYNRNHLTAILLEQQTS